MRIIEKVFTPLLENNVTSLAELDTAEEEDEHPLYDTKKGRWRDGGKLNPKT